MREVEQRLAQRRDRVGGKPRHECQHLRARGRVRAGAGIGPGILEEGVGPGQIPVVERDPSAHAVGAHRGVSGERVVRPVERALADPRRSRAA